MIFVTLLALLAAMVAWAIVGWFRRGCCNWKPAAAKPTEPLQPKAEDSSHQSLDAGKKADDDLDQGPRKST